MVTMKLTVYKVLFGCSSSWLVLHSFVQSLLVVAVGLNPLTIHRQEA